MSDNKILIPQIPSTEVTKASPEALSQQTTASASSSSSLPQMRAPAEKHPVPVSTAVPFKVEETYSTPPVLSKITPAVKLPKSTLKPLGESSSLYEAFGPDAMDIVKAMCELSTTDLNGNTLSLKSTLKETFGASVPSILEILGETPTKTPAPAAKKVLVAKGTMASVASVKKLSIKSTLEEVFGSELGTKMIESVKTEAVALLIKNNTVKPPSNTAVPSTAVLKKREAAKPLHVKAQPAKPPIASASVNKPTVEKHRVPTPEPAMTVTPVKRPVKVQPKPQTFLGSLGIWNDPVKEKIYKLPKGPYGEEKWSNGEVTHIGFDRPLSLISPEELAAHNKKIDEEMRQYWAEREKKMIEVWKSRGIDPNDKAAQAKYDKANPSDSDKRLEAILKRRRDAGLPTTSWVPLGYWESLSDKTINKFLFTVGCIYTFYTYPIYLYWTLGLLALSYVLIFLYKYRRIKERIKHDFRPDPKSKNSEAFERDLHERMRARALRNKKTPPAAK